MDAVCNAGNPNHPKARVVLRYDETMGVSVFVAGARLRKNNYVSFYSVKDTFTGDQYREYYPKGASTLSDAQIWDIDYIIKYDNDMIMIGDQTNPEDPMGIAQYLNCAMSSSGSMNNANFSRL